MRGTLLSCIIGLGILAGTGTMVYAHGGGHGGGHGGVGHGGVMHGGHGGGVVRNGVGRGGIGRGGIGRGGRLNRGYRNWSRYCWFPAYGCYGYFCPDDGSWYYWYGPGDAYLPVGDMATYPPNDSMNPPPSLPPGATSLP